MYYYHRLKDLREDRKYKIDQAEIAELLQTTQQTYSNWETGKREIPFHHVITLANFYDVSIDYIAGRTNDKRGGKRK